MTKLKNTDKNDIKPTVICECHCHQPEMKCRLGKHCEYYGKKCSHCHPEKQGDDWEVEEYVLTDKSLNEEIANISFEFIDTVFEACEKPKGTRSFYISKTSKRIQKMLERVEKQTRESERSELVEDILDFLNDPNEQGSWTKLIDYLDQIKQKTKE